MQWNVQMSEEIDTYSDLFRTQFMSEFTAVRLDLYVLKYQHSYMILNLKNTCNSAHSFNIYIYVSIYLFSNL